MTRILLDECLPVKLKYRFQEKDPDFLVSTVIDQKWTGFKNGTLLSQAQKEFDIFITIDQNLAHQHELSRYGITVIALKAKSNRYKDLLEYITPVCEVIRLADEGHFYTVTL